jgi:2,4-dienoyl-CoA reductase-like NADH-dependent reductase (Old Yellow Enzyme family)
VARAILADPEFANAVIEGKAYTKCYGCQACQYGPFTAHKCPAESVRLRK